jgi:hypothetical protein
MKDGDMDDPGMIEFHYQLLCECKFLGRVKGKTTVVLINVRKYLTCLIIRLLITALLSGLRKLLVPNTQGSQVVLHEHTCVINEWEKSRYCSGANSACIMSLGVVHPRRKDRAASYHTRQHSCIGGFAKQEREEHT